MNSHFWRERRAGRCEAATKSLSDIGEDPELRSGRAPLPRNRTGQ